MQCRGGHAADQLRRMCAERAQGFGVDDRDVRNLIFNRLHMDAAISDGELRREVIERYGERYPDMSPNDWRHIIEAYTSMAREAAQPKSTESLGQIGMAAESVARE